MHAEVDKSCALQRADR